MYASNLVRKYASLSHLLLIGVVLWVTSGVMSCGSQQQTSGTGTDYREVDARAQAGGGAYTPSFFDAMPDLSRITSSAGEFLPYQHGADFAVDLESSRCQSLETNAILTPDYAGDNRQLSDAAFGIYRLELDPAAAEATLSLVWNAAPPAAATGWIGISNWERGVWEWQQLIGTDVAVNTPAKFADVDKHCVVAVVILGTAPVELVSISFGPLPRPRGYTLFSPMQDTSTYLIDDQGNLAHTWEGQHTPGARAMLAESGYLWRQVSIPNSAFGLGGRGGRLEVVDWEGNTIWAYELSTTTQCTHHDFALLPNGNVLLTVWNKYSPAQVINEGRDPASAGTNGLYIDSIMEIEPAGESASVVWQWFVLDHLVQDFNNKAENYGDPAVHPELIDFNYTALQGDDWTHINAIDYNAELDQIALSPLCLSELWIIDHSTTPEEAAGHTGGRYGHGGDLLYRWGNPQAYRTGSAADRQLFGQHNVHWIPEGLEGAGDLLIFNNLAGRPEGLQYSTVVEIVTPRNPDGSYFLSGAVFGPAAPVWTYKADPPASFFGLNMSGVQRLPGGNTLISIGPTGRLFEVTPSGENVWEYHNPYPPSRPSVFRAIRYPVDYPGLANLN